MKAILLTALVLSGLAGFANAETLVQYHDGTTSTAAYNQAAGIAGSALSYASQDAFRTIFGGAGATPAGPTAGTASGSNWRLWRKSAITEALSASDNNAGFTITIGAAANGITLGDLDYGSIRILDASDDSVLAVMEDRSIDGSTSGWTQYSKALPAQAFTSVAGTIKVEFQFEADDIDSFAGWYIDDIAVTIP